MPRMSKDERNAMLEDAVSGETGDNAVVIDLPAPPDPPAPVMLDPAIMAQIAQVVAATMASLPQSGGNVGEAVAQALRDNRTPIPENSDAEYHGRSEYHPGGKDVPRPALRVESWLGAWDHEKRQPIPLFEYEAGRLTDEEIETINALDAGTYPVERNDGQKTTLHVVDLKDANGQVFRRVLCYPKQQFLKEHAQQIPSLKSVRRQVLVAA